MKAVKVFASAAKKSLQRSIKKISSHDNCNCCNDTKLIRRIRRTRFQKVAGVSAFFQCKTCRGSIVARRESLFA